MGLLDAIFGTSGRDPDDKDENKGGVTPTHDPDTYEQDKQREYENRKKGDFVFPTPPVK